MRKVYILLVILSVLTSLPADSAPVKTGGRVTIDFEMVEKGIQWLEFINSGAGDEAVKQYFMTHVAPTKGCQSIIHHWARFRKWDNETFYTFIMTALGRFPTDKRLKNEDGSLTSFGRRRELWTKALKNTDKFKREMKQLKTVDFTTHSVQIAKKYLPAEAVLTANFYFVLFGASNAFSVGRENGYDFFQLSRDEAGTIDIPELTLTFAHEMHHTGFDYLMKKNMKDIGNRENILLVGILAAEGMPTYFIDQPWTHLEQYKAGKDSLRLQLAKDWEAHTARLQELYKEAETDIKLNIDKKIEQKELMAKWMAGIKGPAYVLGADMIGTIDKYLGRKAALNVASDYRRLLTIYNKAAKKAAEKGNKVFLFDVELAEKVYYYK